MGRVFWSLQMQQMQQIFEVLREDITFAPLALLANFSEDIHKLDLINFPRVAILSHEASWSFRPLSI